MADVNGNGNRLGPWKKLDILFLVGCGLMVFGAATFRIEFVFAGAGIAGVPLIQR